MEPGQACFACISFLILLLTMWEIWALQCEDIALQSALLRDPLVQCSTELGFDGLSGILAQSDTRKDGSEKGSHSASERSHGCHDGDSLARATEGDRYSNRLEAKQDSEYDVC
jgi:hypothetical protein